VNGTGKHAGRKKRGAPPPDVVGDDEPTDLAPAPVAPGLAKTLHDDGVETPIAAGSLTDGIAARGSLPEVEATSNGAAANGTAPQALTPPPAPPEALAPKVSVGQAVARGFKDAGAPVMRFLDMVGGHVIMAARALSWLPRRPFRGQNYLEAAEYIGFGSLPIVLLVGAFTGMVMSLQLVFAFRQFGIESVSGGTTVKALAIELGPVLTSLMLAGRAGAGIATELGTMRISEQIDALESMAVNPIQYLVLPRLVAAMVVTPILTLLFFVVGMGGAYLVGVVFEHIDHGPWVSSLRDIVAPVDVIQGLIKSVFFGFIVTLIGCYQGYNATGGGRGVGIGTTRAVVMGSVSTLVCDYFLTDILLSLLGTGKGH
jgi:phospholipid/cholesterol/gamma-HCH transport system permease protein